MRLVLSSHWIDEETEAQKGKPHVQSHTTGKRVKVESPNTVRGSRPVAGAGEEATVPPPKTQTWDAEGFPVLAA